MSAKKVSKTKGRRPSPGFTAAATVAMMLVAVYGDDVGLTLLRGDTAVSTGG